MSGRHGEGYSPPHLIRLLLSEPNVRLNPFRAFRTIPNPIASFVTMKTLRSAASAILGSMLMLMWLLSGCIYDDRSQCPKRFLLQPYYKLHNKQEVDRFEREVHSLTVHVFDAADRYVCSIHNQGSRYRNGQLFPIDLEEGIYSFIVVGEGSSRSFEAGTYHANTPGYFVAGPVVGKTTLADFRVRLKKQGSADAVADPIDEFFFGRLTHQEVMIGDTEPHPVALTKDTKEVEIRFTGTLPAGATPYLYSDNARIDAANLRPADRQTVRHAPYIPSAASHPAPAAAAASYHFHVMRLYDTAHTLHLRLLMPDGSDAIPGFSEELIHRIMASPHYRTQEALDREDYFLIEFKVSAAGTALSIRVNGWEVIPVKPVV